MAQLPGLQVVCLARGGPPILHLDADAFYASVERRDDATLRDVPLAIVSDVVCCASYEARSWGVRSGMSPDEAHVRCPELVTVVPRWDAYNEASASLFRLLAGCVDVVEAASFEEAFLDLGTADWDEAADDAVELRSRIRTQLGLPVSIGIGRTKLLAKIANRRAKPDGLVVITPDREPRVRSTLRIDQIWGVGRVTRSKLAVQGLTKLADLTQFSAVELAPIIGRRMARQLDAIAHGHDDARVLPRRPGIARQRPRSRPTQLSFSLGT
jgi:DNA polymerase IV